MKNTLYWGDNLAVLRGHDGQGKPYFPDECVDLIYLDPPFNSQKTHNLLFQDANGVPVRSQNYAFDDTWLWDEASATYEQTIALPSTPAKVHRILVALHDLLDTSEMMAYIASMTPRLIELHRVLKPTGSLYLHCDPTVSPYMRIVLDAIFGPDRFANEVVWRRARTVKGNFGQGSRMWGANTDSILFYRKSDANTFNPQFLPYSEDYLSKFYKYTEPETGRRYRLISMIGPGGAGKGNPQYEAMGVTRYWRYSRQRMQELIDSGMVVQTRPGAVPVRKQYLDEGKGVAVQSLWDDIDALGPQEKERLGYPTQKPLALLRRIIEAGSNPGDVILDPFCGCGTAIDAAHELGRRWIGIDVTHVAVKVIQDRLFGRFGLTPGDGYRLVGEPVDEDDAYALAAHNPEQFEMWALRLIGALPWEGKQKRGGDRGRDGILVWRDTEERIPRHAVVSVKGGQRIGPTDIRDLIGTVGTTNSEMGIFISLKKPTREMRIAAAEGGMYLPKYAQKGVPRIQLLTVGDLLTGAARVQLPQGSLVIAQKLPTRALTPKPVQKEMTLLTKVPNEQTQSKVSRAGAKRKVTA